MSAEPVAREAVVLRLDGLEKSYGRVGVLRGLSMAVQAGEIYGFLGRNGAGKSTALRTIVGIQEADSGTLEIFGERVARPSRVQKQTLGYVSQEQNFYPWMTAGQLGRFVSAFYPAWDDAEFARLLSALDVPVHRRVSALSGGTQAKLALALALAHRPRLLILDEPTAGLDAAARREFLELVAGQARGEGRATLFSSHIVEEVERVADRVGVLHDGRLAYEGPIPPLLAQVRRLSWPAAAEVPPLPEGFIELQRRVRADRLELVVRAPEEAWLRLDLPSAELAALTLEDVFLALSVGRAASNA